MPDRIEESRRTMQELNLLIAEMREHNMKVRQEIAALSFMTQVYASEAPPGADVAFAHIGGTMGIRNAIVSLYERVMQDQELLPYFQGANIIRIQQRQVEMFLALFGMRDYVGRTLRSVHVHLKITHEHFMRLVGHVEAVLTDAGLPEPEVEDFVDRLLQFEKEIVN